MREMGNPPSYRERRRKQNSPSELIEEMKKAYRNSGVGK